MEKTLTELVRFTVVDTRTINYFGKVGTASFGETLIHRMRCHGINMENTDNGRLIIPNVTKSADFLYTIPVIGTLQKNRFEVTLSKNGERVMYEILCFNGISGKWESSEFEEFIPMDEFSERFPDIMESLTNALPF